jgi:hypothetical protein
MLVNEPLRQQAALDLPCPARSSNGGALVTYYTAREQLEVEYHFTVTASSQPGYMNVIYYPQYWLGLRVALWPVFKWIDGATPGPDQFDNGTYYTHWGSLRCGRLAQRSRALACWLALTAGTSALLRAHDLPIALVLSSCTHSTASSAAAHCRAAGTRAQSPTSGAPAP